MLLLFFSVSIQSIIVSALDLCIFKILKHRNKYICTFEPTGKNANGDLASHVYA